MTGVWVVVGKADEDGAGVVGMSDDDDDAAGATVQHDAQASWHCFRRTFCATVSCPTHALGALVTVPH